MTQEKKSKWVQERDHGVIIPSVEVSAVKMEALDTEMQEVVKEVLITCVKGVKDVMTAPVMKEFVPPLPSPSYTFVRSLLIVPGLLRVSYKERVSFICSILVFITRFGKVALSILRGALFLCS